jgi:hypothetical protein
MDNSARILDRKVTVCSACQQASCWLYIFCCDEFQSAGTKELTIRELHALSLEHPDYWFKNGATGAIDQHGLAEYRAATGAA